MVFLVVCTVALAASLLTFFTGFGLGTLLLPALLFFFEPEVAIALTAVVHLLNGLFKLLLVGRHADLKLAAKFGIPAMLAAFVGAWLLGTLSGAAPLFTWGSGHQVTTVKLAIAVLMLVFAGLELSKRWAAVAVPIGYAPLGGIVTGFFGGLSGHQGALRSAFLIRAGLTKEAFVATGVLISVGVDLARLTVYGTKIPTGDHTLLLLAATLSAFAGAIAGNLLLKKVTLTGMQRAVAALLALIAVGVGSGVL